jgi:copper resistance protein B
MSARIAIAIGALMLLPATGVQAQPAHHEPAPVATVVPAKAPETDPHAGHVAPAAEPAQEPEPDPHAGHVTPAPAPAQEAQADPHAGQVMPAPAPAQEAQADPHAGHVMPAPAPAQEAQADPHAGHVMPAPAPAKKAEPDPHAGHVMPAPASAQEAEPDPHAGHVMPAATPAQENSPDPHAGHVMPGAAASPITPVPTLTDADRAAAFPAVGGHAAHDRSPHAYWLFDHLEATRVDGDAGFGWEADAWIGGDAQRLWIRSEGEGREGSVEAADVELLYGRGISAWWDAVAGVRHQWGEGPSRTALAFGVQGLAPYKIPLEATLYLDSGHASARVEAGYETLLSRRWIVQWEATADLHAGLDAPRGEGPGLATVAAGARLRYEITRRFAPYLGVEHERAFGATADLRRDAGAPVDDTRIVAGVRFWF